MGEWEMGIRMIDSPFEEGQGDVKSLAKNYCQTEGPLYLTL
jgi:hypothetical protein